MLNLSYFFMFFVWIVSAFISIVLLMALLIIKNNPEKFPFLKILRGVSRKYIVFGIIFLWILITPIIISVYNLKSKSDVSKFLSDLSDCDKIHFYGNYVDRANGEHKKIDITIKEFEKIRNISELMQKTNYWRTIQIAKLSASEYLNFDIHEGNSKNFSLQIIYDRIILNPGKNNTTYMCGENLLLDIINEIVTENIHREHSSSGPFVE